MHTNGQTFLRTPSAIVQAAALLLLSGITVAACGVDTTPPVSVLSDDNVCTTDVRDWTGHVTHTAIALDDGDECTTDTCDVLSRQGKLPRPDPRGPGW